KKEIPVWCGGMLEAGVGRAHNIALTTLSQFVLPGDTAGSSHYWKQDIIQPEVVVKNGVIQVSEKPGIGYEIDNDALKKFTVEKKTIDFLNGFFLLIPFVLLRCCNDSICYALIINSLLNDCNHHSLVENLFFIFRRNLLYQKHPSTS